MRSARSPVAPVQHGDHVWTGAELMASPKRWVINLSAEQVNDLLVASAPWADGEDDLPVLQADDFVVPSLTGVLGSMRSTLVDGLGFALVRGLPIAEMSRRQVAAAFLGLGAHVGSPRSQNAAGHLLGHVRDLGLDVNDPEVRIYQTSERQTFHTDSSDTVGLLCLQPAAHGGTSLLVSAAAIYNRMRTEAPHLADELFWPVATDRRGEVPAGAQPWFEIPVLNWFDERLTVIYQRQYIESAARFDHAPKLTDEQVAAFDLFDEIANEPEMHLRMDLEAGDMQFVHNHGLLHDRTGFESAPGSPRHLLRLWLTMADDRQLPPVFEQRYGSITVGDRGGIITAGTTLHAPVV